MVEKYYKYILSAFLGLILGACSESNVECPNLPTNPEIQILGDKVVLSTSVSFPEFREVTTRSDYDVADFTDYELYLVEFEDSGSPLSSMMTAVYHAERKQSTEETTDKTSVVYSVTINKTDQPRILHLIAMKDKDANIPYGPEASVIPSLTTGLTYGADGSTTFDVAYWQRLEFSEGYCVRKTVVDREVWEPNTDELNKLKDVKLVRNIAKISVGYPESGINHNDGSYFILKGFLLVNTPDKGTVAPYSTDGKFFPEFLTADGVQKSYEEIANGEKKYGGISAAGTKIKTLAADARIPDESSNMIPVTSSDSKKWSCLPSQYMFERPFNSINHTYVIVYGRYKSQNGVEQDSYYKLDIGGNGTNNVFGYYGILRNFNYFIRINDVESYGFPSVKEAAEGPVFNNISFDVDTEDLKNMSDGKNIIRVNFTTAVITEDDTKLDFLYAFKENFWDKDKKYDNSLVTFMNLDRGDVILNFDKNTNKLWNGDNPSDPYSVLRITCKNPTADTKTQSFIIVNPASGLGRTINLVSHLKWDYERLCEFAGTWENYPSAYKGLNYENKNVTEEMLTDGTYPNKAGTDQDEVFTIFFDIPANIPEVLFPLEFRIESSYQGLDNDPTGTIVVSYGPTLFPELNGEGQTRIQYIKTVTWTDYNTELLLDQREDNGTLLVSSTGNNIHRVRCRFRTSEVAENGTEIHVRIANDNFNIKTGEIVFRRLDEANKLQGPGLVID